MDARCLIKLKSIVSDEVYDKLDRAVRDQDQKAWDFTMDESHADMQLLRRTAIMDANRKANIVGYMNAQQAKGISPQKSLVDIVSGSGTRQGGGIVSLDRRIEGVKGKYHAELIEMIDATAPTKFGLGRNKEMADNIVKGIFGDVDAKMSKADQGIVDSWLRTTKALLDRFNKAGGNITELENFYIPINHFGPSMLKAGEDTWVKFVKDNFDLRRRPDLMKAEAITDDALLRRIFKNITSEGAVDLNPVAQATQYSKLGNAHQLYRTLQPKDGKAWLDYNKNFGRHTSPIDAMQEYVDGMATEIGLLETLGSNPTKMMEDLSSEVQRVTGNRTPLADAAFDQIRSKAPGLETKLANTFKNIRAFETAVKLPFATLTALSDVAFMSVRAAYLGMDPFKVMTRHMNNLVTQGDYKTAAKHGLMADYAVSRAMASNRYNDVQGFGWLQRVADFSVRVSGLNHWTNSAKAVFGLEFMSSMATQSGKEFGQLPRGLSSAMERYGFSASDWDAMRASKFTKNNVDFLDPLGSQLDEDLQTRIIGMIREETSLAVPEPNAKTRAIAQAGIPTNTIGNELIKTAGQFKTFGITVLTSNLGIALDKNVPVAVKSAYIASLATSATAMGVISLQLKDIARGKDPREFSTKLVAEGFLQGGVIGPVGDIFFKDASLFGGTQAYLAGPSIGDFNNLLKIMQGSYEEAMETGKAWEKVLWPGIVRGAEQVAFPTRLWYAVLAYERLIGDDAHKASDPDYHGKLRRQTKRMKEEHGQGYWMGPK